MAEIIGSEVFERKVLKSKKIVMVDFFATWCRPCQKISHFFDDFTIDYKDKISIYKVDIDKSPDLAVRFGVFSVPTIKFFKDGEEIDSILGAKPKELFERKIEEII